MHVTPYRNGDGGEEKKTRKNKKRQKEQKEEEDNSPRRPADIATLQAAVIKQQICQP